MPWHAEEDHRRGDAVPLPETTYDAVRCVAGRAAWRCSWPPPSCPWPSGCAANFNAQTQSAVPAGRRHPTTAVGDVYALNTLVVADGEGNGTVVGTLLNETRKHGCPDYLVGFEVVDDDGGGVETSALPTAEPVDAPRAARASSLTRASPCRPTSR